MVHRMRIVGIASFMNAAGAQAALLRVMENLRRRGHETETWFFYEEQPTFKGRPHVNSFFEKPKLSKLDYARLPGMTLARLRASKPDAVVTFLPLACVIGQAAARAAGVERRIASQRTPPGKLSRAMMTLDRALGSTGFYTDNVCVSRAVFDDFKSYPARYRQTLTIVHNGIEWQGSTLDRAAARAAFGMAPDETIVVAVGRMKGEQKNFPFMLDILARTPDVRLFIAGDGPLRLQLEAKAEALGLGRRLVLLGALSPPQVADLLRAGDIFLQTSTFEGQSNSILEAMAEGMAIVASDIPMQRESLVRDDGEACAALLPLGDAGPWAAMLETLAAAPAKRRALAEAAKAHVDNRFTLDAMIDGFEQVITGAVSPRPAAARVA
jgi:glycosyltransferase involved in cell wall biosynthesis